MIINKEQYQYISGFRTPVSPILEEMEQYAVSNSVPILDWQAAEFLDVLMRMIKPQTVLEVGTAIGYSTIRMARIIAEEGKVFTIEKSGDNISLAEANFKRTGISEKITILKGEAQTLLPSLRQTFDLIFLDADKKDYLPLLDMLLKKLNTGGTIFVDNLLWHEYAALPEEKIPESYRASAEYIRQFNVIFFNHPILDSVLLPIGDGIGIGVKR
jgi:predicted O-methyltransferase YrrM